LGRLQRSRRRRAAGSHSHHRSADRPPCARPRGAPRAARPRAYDVPHRTGDHHRVGPRVRWDPTVVRWPGSGGRLPLGAVSALRRIAVALGTYVAVCALTFVVVECTPGDPTVAVLGAQGPEVARKALRDSLGL